MSNPYFNYGVTSEQELYEDLVIESVEIYGQTVYYIPRESLGHDNVFNDDILAQYKDAYRVSMYIENTEAFEGEGDLYTKFGVEIRDAATFIVARKRWVNEVATYRDSDEQWYRPREGDLIWLPLSQSMFQIFKVDTENPFYQLENLPVFRMSCELYEYANEDFDTNVEEIDDIEKHFAYQFKLDMESSTSGYQIGETVTQTFTSGVVMSGEVVDWNGSTKQLFIAHSGANDGKFHEFTTGIDLVGSESGVSFNVESVSKDENIDKDNMNDVFDTEAIDFLSFDESNPFGDPT